MLKNIPAVSTEVKAEADERRKATDDAARRAAGRLRGVHLSEESLQSLARSVLEKSVDMDTTLWEQYADMRAYFQNTPFSANAQQRAEAEQRTGDQNPPPAGAKKTAPAVFLQGRSSGADNQIRTGDLILTKDALYRLSYISATGRHALDGTIPS